MRTLGLDYGEKRIGIALSDAGGSISNAHSVYRTRGWTKDTAYLAEFIAREAVEKVVLGDPLNMDGTAGEKSKLTHAFGALLEKAAGVPVDYIDERLTTVEMHDFLNSQAVSKQKRAEVIDKLSAQLILKNYLDNC